MIVTTYFNDTEVNSKFISNIVDIIKYALAASLLNLLLYNCVIVYI